MTSYDVIMAVFGKCLDDYAKINQKQPILLLFRLPAFLFQILREILYKSEYMPISTSKMPPDYGFLTKLIRQYFRPWKKSIQELSTRYMYTMYPDVLPTPPLHWVKI